MNFKPGEPVVCVDIELLPAGQHLQLNTVYHVDRQHTCKCGNQYITVIELQSSITDKLPCCDQLAPYTSYYAHRFRGFKAPGMLLRDLASKAIQKQVEHEHQLQK